MQTDKNRRFLHFKQYNQQKLVSAIKTANRFSPLEGCDCEQEETIEGGLTTPEKDICGAISDIDTETEGRLTMEQPLQMMPNAEEPLVQMDYNQIELIAKTVDYIFRSMNDIKKHLKTLTLGIGKLSATVDKLQQAYPRTQSSVFQKTALDDTQYCGIQPALFSGNQYKMMLRPNSICLMICSYKGMLPSWRNKHEIKQHLSALLKTNYSAIDLIELEPVNHQSQAMKILLTFSSPRIPSSIQRQKKWMRTKGIFSTRVFANSTVVELFPRKYVTNKSLQEVLMPRTLAQSDLIRDKPDGSTETSEQTQIQGEELFGSLPDNQEHNPLENSIEDNLLLSFGNLPLLEQQAIIERLDMVKHQLRTTYSAQLCNNQMDQHPENVVPMDCNNSASPVEQVRRASSQSSKNPLP